MSEVVVEVPAVTEYPTSDAQDVSDTIALAVEDPVEATVEIPAQEVAPEPEPVAEVERLPVDDTQAEAAPVADVLVIDNHTAAILTAQAVKAGPDSKESVMLQPTLAGITGSTTLASTVTAAETPAPIRPSIPQEVTNLDTSADALLDALSALVTKLAPVMASTPGVDGEASAPDDSRAPLAGQLASVNGKLAHVLALMNATTAAVEL
ncbi:hypothetical protein [Pseudomonas sp.]|uniref:hypothetical protein n=1 Tax=Pseudomonas sp. TaxID=306 RepID=UPI002EDAC63E